MSSNNTDMNNTNQEESFNGNTAEDYLENRDTPTEESANETTEMEESVEEAEGATEEQSQDDAVSALQKEILEVKDTLLRERADFINFRKRSTAEREAAQTRATEDILHKLIPALDSFDQLLTVKIEDEGSAGKQVVEGASLIRKMIWTVFTDLGVKELDPVGGAFNPTQMEALSVSESDQVTEERVEMTYQKAYIINDRVIHPARVAVVKPAAAEKAPAQEASPSEEQAEE